MRLIGRAQNTTICIEAKFLTKIFKMHLPPFFDPVGFHCRTKGITCQLENC